MSCKAGTIDRQHPNFDKPAFVGLCCFSKYSRHIKIKWEGANLLHDPCRDGALSDLVGCRRSSREH